MRLKLARDLPELAAFLLDRIQYYFREVRGYAYDEVNAVLAVPVTTLADVAERAEAIHQVRPTPDFEPLAASFKRIKNILKQANVETTEALRSGTAGSLARNGTCMRHLERLRPRLKGKATPRRCADLARCARKVDLFFDKVLVNDPDDAIRLNRLALLGSLLTEFSTIADFSEIVTASGLTG